MDPNATLAEIRELARIVLAADGPDAAEVAGSAALDLAEKFTAMDEWIMRHGFLPTDWHFRGVPTSQG